MKTLISFLAIIGGMTVVFIIAIVVLYFLGCDVSIKAYGEEKYDDRNDYES